MGRPKSYAETEDAAGSHSEYDLFLSHASPDKSWVLNLADRLKALGLRVFVDAFEIEPGDNWVIRLSDALECSRYLVLVLSDHTEGRGWVVQEWTSWMAGHGPLGRVLPVKIDAVDLPFILKSTQSIDATRHDAQQAADELFKVVGDPATLPSDDARLLVLGRDLVFTLSCDSEQLTVVNPSGESRQAPLPWKHDNRFRIAHLGFTKLHQVPVTERAERTELFRYALTLGNHLFEALFDEVDTARLDKLIRPGHPRPVIQVRSDNALLLSLPWELLYHNDTFLVREGYVDLVRTTPTEVAGATLLKEARSPFKLVVNVSAPEGSCLSYEAESYRITLVTAQQCAMVPTELGTLADLVETVDRETPTGIHFSGHGKPGALLFENDYGQEDEVPVEKVLDALRHRLPDSRRLPPFFYLACCHGNTPVDLEKDEPGSLSAVVQLHQAGVTEVVGYFGPIVDELSTRAEEALYEAIANGLPTRDAVRRARHALAQSLRVTDSQYLPLLTRSATEQERVFHTHPFAWAQLVLYRRGVEWPLSVSRPPGRRRAKSVLRRTFEGFGDRRVLRTGFIGRRAEQHRVRRRLREGARVLVFQGLGGLGKSTLAQQVLPRLLEDSENICTLWCQEAEGETHRAETLVEQLLAYCRKRFGLEWEGVVQQVDQAEGDDPANRFVYFLQVLLQNAPELVLYLDNLESLLVGPTDKTDLAAFGQWAEPALETIWRHIDQMARDSDAFYLVASCRYRSEAFSDALLSVAPLPPDALFRLTQWFSGLQRLTAQSRARLVARLEGHPRAVEYANDLVVDALNKWRSTRGEWSLPEPASSEDITWEWETLIAPALPKVAAQLKDNLLLQAIWDQVLDERARRFLYRMTVLRRPAGWSMLGILGDEDEPEETAFATAERLRDTSLLEQVQLSAKVSEVRVDAVTRYTLHPATIEFIRETHPVSPTMRLIAHQRIGLHLESDAENTASLETDLEGGYHLFEAGEYDRACGLLVSASDWLEGRGRFRECLRTLTPFLDDSVQAHMDRRLLGQLLGIVGTARDRLGEVKKAIQYYDRTLDMAREVGDLRMECTTICHLGSSYARLGQMEKAVDYHKQALEIARQIGDREREAAALSNLGLAHHDFGEVDKAIGYYEQAVAITREIGHRQGESSILGNLGLTYIGLGEVEKAIEYYKRQLAIARQVGDRLGEGTALGNLGPAYARLGELEKAIGYLEQHLVIAREIGDRRGEGNTLANIGTAYVNLQEFEKAIGYYEQQLVIARDIGNRHGEATTLANLGLVYIHLGGADNAAELLHQAKAIGETIGNPGIVKSANSRLEKLLKLTQP